MTTEDYPGEVIKEELWRNIEGNELGDYPHKVADKIMDALEEAGYVIVKKQELQHRTSAENCKQGWTYGTPISSGHVCRLCEAQK